VHHTLRDTASSLIPRNQHDVLSPVLMRSNNIGYAARHRTSDAHSVSCNARTPLTTIPFSVAMATHRSGSGDTKRFDERND
jgi:hypothetical protein